MKQLKDVDYKILFKLMKNARTSDRELAKLIGVSQPTVSRKRAFLEKEMLEGYTAVPKWDKIGFEILAVILVKSPLKFASEKEMKDAIDKSQKWLSKQPNVIMASQCRGMGMTGVMISLHKNYTEFDEFMNDHRQQLGDLLEDVQAVVVNLSGKGVSRPLHLQYLAEGIK